MAREPERGDELKRAHRTISDLRARNAALEATLRRVYEAVAAFTPKAVPVRKQTGTSESGEPVYEPDEPEPEPPPEPDRPGRQRKQFWKPTSVPRSNDSVEGAFSAEKRERINLRFTEAMARQLAARK